MSASPSGVVLCVDFGSTFTKAVAVDIETGSVVGTAERPTTSDTDLADGLDAVCDDLAGLRTRAADAEGPWADVLACSSAGGGLRLAVVGYERVVSAEAGYRVALSAGARLAHVTDGPLDDAQLAQLRESRPDVILLVGGTDGGNADVLLHNAKQLASDLAPRVPIVLSGNIEAADGARRRLRRGARTVLVTPNVLPRIGMLDPRPARDAIREVFIAHVIGGKHLSTRVDLSHLVRAATPDAVLSGVELLNEVVGDVVVIDVGGATTDVYSVLRPPDDDAGHHDIVDTLWASRTVEGDLGVRWNATSIVDVAQRDQVLSAAQVDELRAPARRRSEEPWFVPDSTAERDVDETLVGAAATIALRRHARPQGTGDLRQPGKDLSTVRLVVGSGGVLRHAPADGALTVLRRGLSDLAGGWRLPAAPRVVVDRRYVLAAAGLLAHPHPAAARALLQHDFTATT